MPRIAPLRGLHFARERHGSDLSALVCPPYDVISTPERDSLLARHEHNAVRLEFSAEPDPHASAAATLEAWLMDGTLVAAAKPSVHVYAHARSAQPDEPIVHGLLARVLLEPWGRGVRRHEHTMPGPKADRLALLRAARTQLSPILCLYFDGSNRYGRELEAGGNASDRYEARDRDGLLHQLARLDSPESGLLEHLGDQILYVADGHHRYETALAYQREVRSDPQLARSAPGDLAADWIMAVLVNAASEELEILPTHRILPDADADALHALVTSDPLFRVSRVEGGELEATLNGRANSPEPIFGLVLRDGEFLLMADAAVADERLGEAGVSDALRSLDLATLHVVLLGDRLGIGADEVAAGDRLIYTRDSADAIERVRSGRANAAILVRPTRLEQLAAVASAGEVMPQKSTYFHPKLLTGMVFHPLFDVPVA